MRIDKGYDGRRPRTRIHMTDAGRKALDAELDRLRDLLKRADQAAPEARVAGTDPSLGFA